VVIEPAAQAPTGGNSWLTYALYALPGLVVLGLFYLFYQRLERKANPEDDLLLADDGFDGDALGESEPLDSAAGFDTSVGAEELDDMEPPTIDEVEPPPPEQTEAPRANMEDALDTSALEQNDGSDLDNPARAQEGLDTEDDEDSDLFDISSIDDSLSDLDDLNLDEDEDPFAEFDDLDDQSSQKR
jgi:hypothetical protein